MTLPPPSDDRYSPTGDAETALDATALLDLLADYPDEHNDCVVPTIWFDWPQLSWTEYGIVAVARQGLVGHPSRADAYALDRHLGAPATSTVTLGRSHSTEGKCLRIMRCASYAIAR